MNYSRHKYFIRLGNTILLFYPHECIACKNEEKRKPESNLQDWKQENFPPTVAKISAKSYNKNNYNWILSSFRFASIIKENINCYVDLYVKCNISVYYLWNKILVYYIYYSKINNLHNLILRSYEVIIVVNLGCK